MKNYFEFLFLFKDGLRLSKVFGVGSAESWLIQQAQYDLWQVRNRGKEFNVKSFIPATTALNY
jgi:plasmid maintenance system antidote protein VapI